MVEFEHQVSGSEEAFTLHCVNYILDAWKADHGITLPDTTIRISSHFRVHWGREEIPIPPWSDDPWFTITTTGEAALGWYIPGHKLIYIVAGRWGSARTLYHELCHIITPTDVDHQDSRWPQWAQREREIFWKLRGEWFDWDSSGKLDRLDKLAEAAQASIIMKRALISKPSRPLCETVPPLKRN